MSDRPPPEFGATLRQAREARGLTLRDLSSATKIIVSSLEAIEHDDLGSLPGGVFTRGFVRSYARAVGLDVQTTMAAFERRFPAEAHGARLSQADDAARRDLQPRWRMMQAVGGVTAVGAVLLLLFLFMPRTGGQGSAVVDDARAANRPGVDRPAQAAVPAPVLTSASTPASTTVPTSAEAPPAARPSSAALTIEIRPIADCWVSASIDGDELFSRVIGPGERQVIEASEEIALRIGDAGAFAFTINQRPGRSLGAPGQVVNARFTPSNYLRFVAE